MGWLSSLIMSEDVLCVPGGGPTTNQAIPLSMNKRSIIKIWWTPIYKNDRFQVGLQEGKQIQTSPKFIPGYSRLPKRTSRRFMLWNSFAAPFYCLPVGSKTMSNPWLFDGYDGRLFSEHWLMSSSHCWSRQQSPCYPTRTPISNSETHRFFAPKKYRKVIHKNQHHLRNRSHFSLSFWVRGEIFQSPPGLGVTAMAQAEVEWHCHSCHSCHSWMVSGKISPSRNDLKWMMTGGTPSWRNGNLHIITYRLYLPHYPKIFPLNPTKYPHEELAEISHIPQPKGFPSTSAT